MNDSNYDNEKFNHQKKYPLQDDKSILQKRKKINKYDILSKIKNPSISHFNINSNFIFSERDFINYFNTIQNKNSVKLNKVELDFLSDKINEINILTNTRGIDDFIEIDEQIGNNLKNFKPLNNTEDEVTNFVENKIKNSKNRAEISCRKLSTLYLQEKGKFICKSTIHKIIKNKLGFRYIKTCKKSNFLKTDLGKFSCFAFIKIIYKSLFVGFEFIFIDESTIKLNNTNFKCWRHYSEQIYFGKNDKSKINLLLAVTKDDIFHYELLNENTNSEKFLNFMKALNEKLKKKNDTKYVIIMDNCTVHKTEELIKYYKDEKINVLFNVQYCSYFNCIELCFRSLKKILYNKLYEKKEEIIQEIELFFKKEETKITLNKNYNETLRQYISYSQENKSENLNNYIIEI